MSRDLFSLYPLFRITQLRWETTYGVRLQMIFDYLALGVIVIFKSGTHLTLTLTIYRLEVSVNFTLFEKVSHE